MKNINLSVAQIVPCTQAEGPGKRFALWFQGCPLRCPGCCNPEMLPFHGGTSMQLAEVLQRIDSAMTLGIEGITLLGGEPLAHADGAAALAQHAQNRGLSVMVFTGFMYEDLRAKNDPAIEALLSNTDILVDGPYDRTQPERERRWIGSRNQRIFFLSDRYRADDPCWRQANTLEIRWHEGELMINGFPAKSTRGLWTGKHQA